jgi:hypothetical protein
MNPYTSPCSIGSNVTIEGLCLVNRMTVEVEWLEPLVIRPHLTMVVLCWISFKEQGGRRVMCFHVRSSEGGSPRLCRLRTASIGLRLADFDYVLTNMEFMGFCKLSNLDGHRVGRYPTYLQDVNRYSVWATHGYPSRHRAEDVHLGEVGLHRLFDYRCELLSCVGPSRSYMRHVVRLSLARCILIQISATLLDMSDSLPPRPKIVMKLS